jgi:hypothetical protein
MIAQSLKLFFRGIGYDIQSRARFVENNAFGNSYVELTRWAKRKGPLNNTVINIPAPLPHLIYTYIHTCPLRDHNIQNQNSKYEA